MNGDGAQRTHAIVSNLIRALTHKIRTPLSVISNELETLKAIFPATELAASRQRVTQIAELLKALSQFAVSPSPKQRFDAQEILQDIITSQQGKLELQTHADKLSLLGDRRLFSLALTSLANILLQLASPDSHKGSELKLQSRIVEGCGLIVLRSEFRSSLDNSAQRSWSSLSEFFNDGIDLDSFLPSCIDSILLAQGATVSVATQSGIEITLQFPLCEQAAQMS